MGLFDKLLDVVGSIVDSAQNPNSFNMQSFKTPVAKRYYSNILELLSTTERLTKENIKAYFKVQNDEECDEVALDEALSKFESINEPRHNEIWYKLSFEQQKKEKVISSLKKDDIYDICFKDYIDKVKWKFEEVLHIVSQKPSKEFFEDGLQKIERDLKFPDGYNYPQPYLAGKTIGKIMVERLLAKDDTVIAIVVEEVCEHLYHYKGLERIYAFALRALCFNEKSNNLTEYLSISKEDYYNAATNSSVYKKDIEENPFDKDSIINRAVEKMSESTFIDGTSGYVSDFDWRKWASKDMRFIDAACFYTWKEIAKNYKNDATTELELIVKMIINHIINQ